MPTGRSRRNLVGAASSSVGPISLARIPRGTRRRSRTLEESPTGYMTGSSSTRSSCNVTRSLQCRSSEHISSPSIHSEVRHVERVSIGDSAMIGSIGRGRRVPSRPTFPSAIADKRSRSQSDPLTKRAHPYIRSHNQSRSHRWTGKPPGAMRPVVSRMGTILRALRDDVARSRPVVNADIANSAALGNSPRPRHRPLRHTPPDVIDVSSSRYSALLSC